MSFVPGIGGAVPPKKGGERTSDESGLVCAVRCGLAIGQTKISDLGEGCGNNDAMSFSPYIGAGEGAGADPPKKGGWQTSDESSLMCCNALAVGCMLALGSTDIFLGKENGTNGVTGLVPGMSSDLVLSEAPYSLISLLYFKPLGSELGKGTNGANGVEPVN